MPAIDNRSGFQQTMSVHRALGIFLAAAVLALTSATDTRADSEIVIAIRYLQAKGISHSHLYLYRGDGKLLHQLTNDNSGQESDPIFSSDSHTIIFTREKPHNVREFWSIEPDGTNLKKLDAAPEWYAGAKSSPRFTNIQPEEPASTATTSPVESASSSPTPAPTFKSPDGSVEIVLRNGPGYGNHYLFRDLSTGAETEFQKLPGFYGVAWLLQDSGDKHQSFLLDGPLRVAFFGLHLNSTDGDTVFALDLNGPRFVRLSPNWATPIPLPGEAAFLTLTENRYAPIPGSEKTSNCSYVEHWDAKLDQFRYAREKSAALCYGASMYRPGLTPSTITIRRSSNLKLP